MKKPTKKLSLIKEVVQKLTENQLVNVVGGLETGPPTGQRLPSGGGTGR